MSEEIIKRDEAAEGNPDGKDSSTSAESRPPRPLEPLYREHPQTVALFLAALRPETSASLFARLEYAEQFDIACRIARFNPTVTAAREAPRVVCMLSAVLKDEARLDPEKDVSADFPGKTGPCLLASILEHCPYGTRRRVILVLADTDPEAAFNVRKSIFIFDDLLYLSDGSAEKVFRAADADDLARAMRAAGEDLKNKIYRVLPEGRSGDLKELLDWSGAVELRVVEDAQERIVSLAKDMAYQGIIDPAGEFENGRRGSTGT